MERIVIEVDAQTKQDLRATAFKENKSMKELLTEAIKTLIKKNKGK